MTNVVIFAEDETSRVVSQFYDSCREWDKRRRRNWFAQNPHRSSLIIRLHFMCPVWIGKNFTFLDRPVCERRDLIIRIFLFIYPNSLLQRPSTDILETFPHDVALVEKESLLCQFLKVHLTKMRGENPQFSLSFAPNRNIDHWPMLSASLVGAS